MASSYKNPPTMRSGLSYDDWKKELKIWQRAITLDSKQQGVVLLLSLEGRPRETVLAEVKEEAYDKDDIVTVIIACLDGLLKKEKSETQYGAFDEFITFRRPKSQSIEKFIQDFNLRYTKVKHLEMPLPDGVLAYALLKCCNLTDDQTQLCRATVTDLTYDNMKKQIKKVAESAENPSASTSVPVNYSRNFECSNSANDFYDEDYDWDESDQYDYQDDQPTDASDETVRDALYSHGPSRGHSAGRGSRGGYFRGKQSRNGYDDMGNIRTCRYCKSIYHMLSECPDAPPHLKDNYRGQYRGSRGSRGGRGRGYRGQHKF